MINISLSELQSLMKCSPEAKKAIEKQLGKAGALPANKYKNQKVYVYKNGYISTSKLKSSEKPEVYDSFKEFNRWNELKLMERAGLISNLTKQKVLIVQQKLYYNKKQLAAITYKADFSYIKDGTEIVEDVKGYDRKRNRYRTTEAFNIKWKLLKAKYPNIIFKLY